LICLQGKVIEEILFPRQDSYLRLGDFKSLLAAKGFDDIWAIEYYNFGTSEWTQCTLDTPHFVAGNDYSLQIRYAD
jgi:hypothetical protein